MSTTTTNDTSIENIVIVVRTQRSACMCFWIRNDDFFNRPFTFWTFNIIKILEIHKSAAHLDPPKVLSLYDILIVADLIFMDTQHFGFKAFFASSCYHSLKRITGHLQMEISLRMQSFFIFLECEGRQNLFAGEKLWHFSFLFTAAAAAVSFWLSHSILTPSI